MSVYTQADLDSLDRAIATGQLSVQFGDRRIQYRTMDEMLQARRHIESQLSSAPKRSVFRFTFATGRGH
jgi:hypothetical protein